MFKVTNEGKGRKGKNDDKKVVCINCRTKNCFERAVKKITKAFVKLFLPLSTAAVQGEPFYLHFSFLTISRIVLIFFSFFK